MTRDILIRVLKKIIKGTDMIRVKSVITTYLSSYAVLTSMIIISFLLIIAFFIIPSQTLIVEILKISVTTTVTIIGLGLVAITYAKGVLATKYFSLEGFELEEQVTEYVLNVIDFFHEKVSPLIKTSREWKTIETKIEKIETALTSALRGLEKDYNSLQPTFDALHEADTKTLMIEFARLFHLHREENPEEWSEVLEERNKLHEKYWPLVKRVSNFSDIRRMVSPRFLLIIVLGITEILLAFTLILSISTLPAQWIYVIYAVQSFLLFYVVVATMQLLWEFLRW